MPRRGIRISIPAIEESNGSYSKFCKNTTGKFRGRPTKVLIRLVKYGIEKGWFDGPQVFKALIWFGFDSDYINDMFLAKTTFEYLLKNMQLKKEESLQKIEEEEET